MRKIVEFLRYLKNNNLNPADAFRVLHKNQTLGEPITINPLDLGRPLRLRGNGSSDIDVFREIWVSKEYDIQFQFPITRIIDAGANCGISTLFFSQKFPNAEIAAIEPDLENISALRENTHNLECITVYPNALHGRNCKVLIENSASNRQWGFTTSECASTDGGIETITVTQIMREKSWDYIDLLKIDIEGGEIEVFTEGDLQWIRSVNVIIIELHDWIRKGCSQAFFQSLQAFGDYDFSMSGESVIITRREILGTDSNRT